MAATGRLQARFLSRLDEIAAADWDRLGGDRHAFASHAFLAGLEQHDCLHERFGWRPHHLVIEREGGLVAAAPCYLKGNSHGEFVFDHAWAEAYQRHGLPYYPKLLVAVPYSPVSAPRLLVAPDEDQRALRLQLLDALEHEALRLGLSGAHVNFHGDQETEAFGERPLWLARSDLQFHWRNAGYRDFADFLDHLSARKRKNIRQERARISGLSIERIGGDRCSVEDIDAMHGFYASTFALKGNLPVLTRDFFEHLARGLGSRLLLVLARRGAQPVAGALLVADADCLHGRYWGCSEEQPGLHFELCYYQGIEHCIAHGIGRFEPGAQGQHKLARGFLPSWTHSHHRLFAQPFSDAIGNWLVEERRALESYRSELMRHSPFRDAGDAAA